MDSLWTLFLSTGVLAVSAILAVIGSTIKYRTGTSNELISIIITIISYIIWSVMGLVEFWGIRGTPDFWLAVFFRRGFNYGVISAGLSVYVWDLVHGGYKYRKVRKEETNDQNSL